MIILPLEHKRRHLAFGLAWRILDPFESHAAQIKRLRDDGARWGAQYRMSIKGSKDTYLGTAAMFEKPRRGQVFAAAALAAGHPAVQAASHDGNVVVLLSDAGNEELGIDATYMLIVLRQGAIKLDLAGTEQEIEAARRQIVEAGLQEDVHYETLDSLTLDDLYSGSKTRAVISPLKNTRPAIYLAIGIIAVVGASVGWLEVSRKNEMQRKLQALQSAEESSPEARYRAEAQKHLREKVMLASELGAMTQAIESLPLVQSGFALTEVTCNANGCHASWRHAGGTYAAFAQAVDAAWRPTFDASGTSITTTLPIPDARVELPNPQTWSTFDEAVVTRVSRWQPLMDSGFKVVLERPRARAVPSGIQEEAARAMPDAVLASGWSINAAPWVFIEEVAAFSGAVTIDELKVKFDNGITFSAGGLLYVKK